MNKLTIIGNLVRDPELRTTGSGHAVCSFTVAVNRRKSANGQQEADFFRVSAWRQLGENCQRYLAKGRKVAVVGPVSVSTYQANDGNTRAQLEVTADDVEFLSSKSEEGSTYPATSGYQAAPAPQPATNMAGFEPVDDEDLPF
jgi:single-strand DNA-binding protein